MPEQSNFAIQGIKLCAHDSGALYIPSNETLVVSDLHLGKGEFFARSGQFLPPYDTADTLARLLDVIKTYAPMRLIALGDSFHDKTARNQLADNTTLGEMIDRVPEWIWVAGNHDPGQTMAMAGAWVDEMLLDRMVFRHQAIERPRALEISGHFHPKAGLRLRGRKISGKCFIHDHHRLIMPAFGAFTGGLNINDPVFNDLMVEPFVVKMITRAGLTTLSSARMAV